MAQFEEHEFFPDILNLKVSELVVATADATEERVGEAVTEALSILRHRLKMDVVYVSEFVGDKRVLRYVDAPTDGLIMAPGDSDPLEETWCKMVVDGRIPEMIADVQAFPGKDRLPLAPFEIGTYMSTPVRLNSGRLYGTLCTISFSPNKAVQQRDLQTLRSVATLVARKIDMAHAAPGGQAKKVWFSPVPK